jgi:hypothetical protein
MKTTTIQHLNIITKKIKNFLFIPVDLGLRTGVWETGEKSCE